jgi:cytochrome o ubiquinol oxidase subunit 1
VEGRDAFYEMKRQRTAYRRPERYEDIYIPKNTGVGPILGALAFVLGFAIVWHIWWLVVVSAVAMLAAVVTRCFDDDPDTCITAAEVEAIENQRFEALALAEKPHQEAERDPAFTAQMLPGRAT